MPENDDNADLAPRQRAKKAQPLNAGNAGDQVSLADANAMARRMNQEAADGIAKVQAAAGRAIRQTMAGDDPKTTKPLTPLKAQRTSDAARKAAGQPVADHTTNGAPTT